MSSIIDTIFGFGSESILDTLIFNKCYATENLNFITEIYNKLKYMDECGDRRVFSFTASISNTTRYTFEDRMITIHVSDEPKLFIRGVINSQNSIPIYDGHRNTWNVDSHERSMVMNYINNIATSSKPSSSKFFDKLRDKLDEK
jgi:hypothetical protein